VRELRNILERAAILCDGGLITADYLALTAPRRLPVLGPAVTPSPEGIASDTALARPSSASDLQSMERAMIEQALQDARFNKSKAAIALGLTRQQLYVRMRKYGLE
jgi:two-component system response regulator PilR (NtrC family)